MVGTSQTPLIMHRRLAGGEQRDVGRIVGVGGSIAVAVTQSAIT